MTKNYNNKIEIWNKSLLYRIEIYYTVRRDFFMDLIKKNIHMNKLKCKSNMQVTLDDDFNVPDTKPDVERIIKEQGRVIIKDITPMNGKLMIKGGLQFNLLYISEERSRPVNNIQGEIPFEEIVNMEESCQEDQVIAKWEIEDLSTGLINSRKLSVRAIVSFNCSAEEIYDEETAIEVEGDESVQSKTTKMDITQLIVNKKDTLRVKDEVRIPSGKANVYDILYHNVALQGVDARVFTDKIQLKGEFVIFLLYVGDDEAQSLQYFETELPFQSTIECSGCEETMIPNILVDLHNSDLVMKPDEDGEERIIDCEIVLDLDMKVYEDEQVEILSDLYSTKTHLNPVRKQAAYKHLVMKNNSKARVSDHIKVGPGQPRILQICNTSGTIRMDEKSIVENGIEVEGVLEIQLLYIGEVDDKPLGAIKGMIPFHHTIEMKGINEDSIIELSPGIEQISSIMLDSEDVEVKVSMNLDVVVFDKVEKSMITDLTEEEFDLEKLEEMPSVTGYLVKQGDTLWDIAKQFYTTIEEVKELNHLDKDTITLGDKLLLMKKVETVL